MSLQTEMRKSSREHSRFMRRYDELERFQQKLLRMPEGPEFDAMLAKYERMVEAL